MHQQPNIHIRFDSGKAKGQRVLCHSDSSPLSARGLEQLTLIPPSETCSQSRKWCWETSVIPEEYTPAGLQGRNQETGPGKKRTGFLHTGRPTEPEPHDQSDSFRVVISNLKKTKADYNKKKIYNLMRPFE